MKLQQFQQRNLLLHGSWKWLVTEFASYFGVSDAYTKLRYHNLSSACELKERIVAITFVSLREPLNYGLPGIFRMLWMLPHQLQIV